MSMKKDNNTSVLFSDIEKLLDKTTIRNYKLEEGDTFTIEAKNAKDLLTPKRLDLVAKYMYLLFSRQGIKSNLANDIYKKHIEIFSDGKFYEPDSDTKTSYDSFLKEFDDIFAKIERDGFDSKKSLIPVGNDGTILNGAHRIATAMYLNKEVSILSIDKSQGINYDYEYFKKGCMETRYLDFLALNYVKLSNKNMYAICLWPRAVSLNKMRECEEIIKSQTTILYKKQLNLSQLGLKNFMANVYQTESWVGGVKNNYVGTYGKVDPCYAKAKTIVYFVEGGTLESILKLKDNIRTMYGIGKHSVHITDNTEETIRVANLILNTSSESVLNLSRPNKCISELANRDYAKDEILNPMYTLALFGHEIPAQEQATVKIEQLKKDVLYDTSNFLYFRGMRFFSPQYAKENCDAKYARQFDSILKTSKTPLSLKTKEGVTKTKYKVKRKIRYMLRKAGVLDKARAIIH